jgi:hypothetical protein
MQSKDWEADETNPRSVALRQREWLWTWSGEPIGYREHDDLWTYDGRHVGCFHGDEIYGADRRYIGELMDGHRLITARFKRAARRAIFAPQPPRARLPRGDRLPVYRLPTGYEDFPLPENLP